MAEKQGAASIAGKAARRLLVFDLDGTLVDTLGDLARCCNHALSDCGFPVHAPDAYRMFVGNGVYKLVERALAPEHADAQSAARVKELFDAYYAQGFLQESKPYEGIQEVLRSFSADGAAIAVLSNKPHAFTQRMVGALFHQPFAAVIGHRDGAPAKPSPQGVLEILQKTGAAREAAVYIGDSDVDVYTGHNAGLPVIGCAWGFRGAPELRAAGADAIVQAPRDLPDAVRQILA